MSDLSLRSMTTRDPAISTPVLTRIMQSLQCLCIGLFLCLVSCTMPPKTPSTGYHAEGASGALLVKQKFQFTTGPWGLGRVHHTYTIPAGVFLAIGADQRGTFYAAPSGWMSLKVGFIPDSMHGGLYRAGSQIAVYAQAFNEMGILFGGGKPLIVQPVPSQYNTFVEVLP